MRHTHCGARTLHNSAMRFHKRPGARVNRPGEASRLFSLCESAPAVLALAVALGNPARADWTLGADVRARHDSNVSNARDTVDIVADSALSAKLTLFNVLPVPGNISLLVNGGLDGEVFHKLDGLNNASIDAGFGVKKKWGLGALAPWVRAGVAVNRFNYNDANRDAWVYRTALAAGRRIDPRWSVWAEYAFERRAAIKVPDPPVPGISADAYSQSSHGFTISADFSMSENTFLELGLLARHGDVVAITEPGYQIYAASSAIAKDLTFGSAAYAYKLTGTSYGVRLGLSFAPTAHSLLGCGFQRLQTRAQGGNNYSKSLPDITWDYRF